MDPTRGTRGCHLAPRPARYPTKWSYNNFAMSSPNGLNDYTIIPGDLPERLCYLKLASGRALTGQSHDYKRHGTTTLFAALDVATGTVSGRHYKRRRRIEFLDFMNRLVATHPGREIHVILDNLKTSEVGAWMLK